MGGQRSSYRIILALLLVAEAVIIATAGPYLVALSGLVSHALGTG
jgi:hypothetical protein